VLSLKLKYISQRKYSQWLTYCFLYRNNDQFSQIVTLTLSLLIMNVPVIMQGKNTKDSVCRLHPFLQQSILVYASTAAETTTYQSSSSNEISRPQWPHGLSRGSARTRLLVCGFESLRGHGFLLSVECCQVEVSASGWSLFQRSPTQCGLTMEGKRKPRTTRPWPGIGSKRYWKRKVWNYILLIDLDKKEKLIPNQCQGFVCG
jgi:hypothetical protein